MSTTRDLFGYAGASHQPQGRVLTAEEEYGLGAFGALDSASLEEEEEYGLGAFGALDSASLEAEEEYGEDDEDDDDFGAWYGADDDDDDDDEDDDDEDSDTEETTSGYGGGWWYGADDEDDEDDDDFGFIDEYGAEGSVDDDLAMLDADLDEDLYGAWYGAAGGTLAVPAGTEPALAQLGDVLNAPNVLLPEFLNPAGAEPGWVEWGLAKMEDFIAKGDADEIAAYLMNEPGFSDWNSLSDLQREQLVRSAVKKSAIPGLEQNWDEPLRQAWNSNPGVIGSSWAGLKATPSAVWALLVTDFPAGLLAWLSEVPGLNQAIGALRQRTGATSPDQMINGLAMRYFVIGLVFPQIYSWMAQRVTQEGQAAVHAVQAASAPAPAQDLGVLPVPPPPQALPVSGTGLPSPQTVLAIGYGVMAAGAVLNVFK